MNENFETESSFGKQIAKEAAKSAAVALAGNAIGIAVFIGLGYANKKIQDRKARKQENTEN